MLFVAIVFQQGISQFVDEAAIENTPVIFLVFVRLISDFYRQCILKDERCKNMGRLYFHILKSAPGIDAHPWHVEMREDRRINQSLSKNIGDALGRFGSQLELSIKSVENDESINQFFQCRLSANELEKTTDTRTHFGVQFSIFKHD